MVESAFSIENFNQYIVNSASNFSSLLTCIRDTKLTELNIRVNVWRILLGVFSAASTSEEKRRIIEKSRATYAELNEKFKQKAQAQEVNKPKPVFNPLAKNIPTNPYTGYFEDNELRTEIKKDVDRTYQDMALFSENKVKQILSNVLFVFSKKHSDVSYKQGMNEIAASFIIIYLKEAAFISSNTISATSTVPQESIELAKFLLNMDHAEADIYTLFSRMMELGHIEMFRPSLAEDNKKKQEYNVNSKKQQAILMRIARIQDHHLKTIDLDLFKHMKLLGVEFQIFLLRWIRCVHTREYHLDDTFHIWDCIFLEYSQNPVEDNNFFLIDCICLAMMEYVRTQLLEKEESSQCLQRFLKFPPVEDIKMIMDMAFKVKDVLLKSQQEQQPLLVQQSSNDDAKVVKSMQQGNKNLILFSTGFTNKSSNISNETYSIREQKEMKLAAAANKPQRNFMEERHLMSKPEVSIPIKSAPIIALSKKPEAIVEQQDTAGLVPVVLSSTFLKSNSSGSAPTKSNPAIASANSVEKPSNSIPIPVPVVKAPEVKETMTTFKSSELTMLQNKMQASLDTLNTLFLRDTKNDELRKVIDDLQFVEQELKRKANPPIKQPVFASSGQNKPVLFTSMKPPQSVASGFVVDQM